MISISGKGAVQPLPLEPCPKCRLIDHLRTKPLLVDERWKDEPEKDARLKYFTDLRVDGIEPAFVKDAPFEQFVDGFYCDLCAEGFIPDAAIKEVIRYVVSDGQWNKISSKDHP